MEETGGNSVVNSNLSNISENENNLSLKTVDTPLKWCSVSLSDVISRGKRLEASVFDVEAKQAHDIIINGKYTYVPLLGENGIIKTAYYPGRFKRIYCGKENGEAFFLPSQMTDIYPKAEKYISRLTKCDISELKLKKGTLLLTRSGTIGNISLVSRTNEGKVYSDDVIRVTFNDKIDLGYSYAFLKSKIGNIVLQTNGYGSVITHLEPEHLGETYIPNAPKEIKERIHNLIVQSFDLLDESNELIDESTNLLIEELKLPPISELKKRGVRNSSNVNTFSVKLSNLAGRVDASYHLPIVDTIVEHLKKYAKEVTTIGDERISSEVILPGRFKRVYVDEGYGRIFIGGKQLGELDPSSKKYLSNVKHSKQIDDELMLSEAMTLITRSGTIGKVALVPKHWEHWIASEHIIRVVPANIEIAGYLNIFLSSEYGHQLITRFTYGSVVDEIDDNHIRQIAIPLLKNQDIQNKINDLALKANQKRYEAYMLEQEALKIMNEEVIYAK